MICWGFLRVLAGRRFAPEACVWSSFGFTRAIDATRVVVGEGRQKCMVRPSIAGGTIKDKDDIKTDFDPVTTEREAAAFSLHRGLPLS
jgi:hypothetical protein